MSWHLWCSTNVGKYFLVSVVIRKFRASKHLWELVVPTCCCLDTVDIIVIFINDGCLWCEFSSVDA